MRFLRFLGCLGVAFAATAMANAQSTTGSSSSSGGSRTGTSSSTGSFSGGSTGSFAGGSSGSFSGTGSSTSTTTSIISTNAFIGGSAGSSLMGGSSGGGGGGFGGGGGGGFAGGGGGFGGTTTRFSVDASNPFSKFYSNPFHTATSSSSTRTTFGTAIYAKASNANTSNSSLNNRSSGLGSSMNNASTANRGTRAPRFVAAFELSTPRPATNVAVTVSPRILGEMRSVLDNSISLPAAASIRLVTEQDTVVLRGDVGNDGEKRLAESMLRLTPGVYNIRNELTVKPRPMPPEGSPDQ